MADIVNEQGKEPEVSKEDMEKLESVKKACLLYTSPSPRDTR